MSSFIRNHLPVHYAAVLIMAAVLAGCGEPQAVGGQPGSQLPTPVPTMVQPISETTVQLAIQPTVQPTVQVTGQPTIQPTGQPTIQPVQLSPLIAPGLDLRAGPVDLPLELQIPALKVNALILGVGINSQYAMDAPTGRLTDPVWQKVFWYRGSGVPGDSGTAAFAGHVNDTRGRPAIFAQLTNLRPGDLIVVHNLQSGLDIDFSVVRLAVYSRQQAADPAVLAQVYGPGPVAGKGPQPAADGLAHLTLITCIGDFVGGSFDHRLVVFATRRNELAGVAREDAGGER